jgi:hypothetical protein
LPVDVLLQHVHVIHVIRSQRNEFDEGRRQLYDLLERVEGCSHVTDVPTRFLLHDGDLVEMDIAENSALHRVHGYLMNDGFMVATWLPNRRGPVRSVQTTMSENSHSDAAGPWQVQVLLPLRA